MAFIVSLIVGAGLGAFLVWAADFKATPARIVAVSIAGALVLGWIVPWVLHFQGFWSGLILGGIGALVALYVHSRVTTVGNEYRQEI